MTTSFMKHSECMGNVFLDVSRLFTMQVPNISLQSNSISIGAFELQRVRAKNVRPELFCVKCHERFSLSEKEGLLEIIVECSVCRTYKPMGEILNCAELSRVCLECKGHITAGPKAKSPPEHIKPYLRYLSFSKDTTFVPLESLFQNITV